MNKKIIDLEDRLSGVDAGEILRIVSEEFSGQIVFASSLGLEDQVILDLIRKGALDIPIFTLDTGRLFPETFDLLERVYVKYGIRVKTFSPDAVEVEDMVNNLGPNLFRENVEFRKRCCNIRKVQPLRRALNGKDAWVCGLRRDQSVTRSEERVIEWDEGNSMVKINPIIVVHAE